MENLIKRLKKKGALQSSLIEEALRFVDRKDFVLPEWRDYSYEDAALPILEDQTISQPYTVVFMLESLSLESGMTVIDIGAGSGWQTALLSFLVGKEGRVYAYEISPLLLELAKNNVAKYPQLFDRVEWMPMSGKNPPGVSFHRLIAAASVQEDPPSFWREDLLSQGRIIYPSKNSIILEKKNGSMSKDIFPGFVFVPFK